MGRLDPERQLLHERTGSVQTEYGASITRLYGINKLCKIRFQEVIGVNWCKLPGTQLF